MRKKRQPTDWTTPLLHGASVEPGKGSSLVQHVTDRDEPKPLGVSGQRSSIDALDPTDALEELRAMKAKVRRLSMVRCLCPKTVHLFTHAFYCVVRVQCVGRCPIISHNFIILATFPIFYAICMRNHRMLIRNVVAG